MNIYICIIVLICLKEIQSKIVKAELNLFIQNLYILIYLSDKEVVYLSVDSESQSMWISELLLNKRPEDAMLLSKFNTTIKGYEATVEEYEDKIEVINYRKNDTTKLKMNYLIVSDNIRESIAFEAVGAFAFKVEDKKYSITHMLYESGEIQERSFSLNCLNRTRNEMYFGGVPQEKRMKYQAELKVRELNEKWNVNMEYVIYSNKANVFYRNNFISYFTTNKRHVKCPQFFYDLMKENYLHKAFTDDLCETNKYDDTIKCRYAVVNILGNITFVFDNIKIEKNVRELFQFHNNMYEFIFHRNRESNEWAIGIDFFITYITTFDYDAKSIILHSNSKFDLFYSNTNSNTKTNFDISLIIKIDSMLLLLFTILNIFIVKSIK